MSKSLYNYLLEFGYATEEKLQKAIDYQANTRVSASKALLETKIVTENTLLNVYSDFYGYEILKTVNPYNFDDLLKKLDGKQLSELLTVPHRTESGEMYAYTCNPANTLAFEDYVYEAIGYSGSFRYFLVTEKNFKKLMDNLYGSQSRTDIDISSLGITPGSDLRSGVYNISEDDISGIVTLVNHILREAVHQGVSDVHFEPQENFMAVRFRDDGLLREFLRIPKNVTNQVINRIKTMSSLDVNNSRIIQDGNVRLEIFDKLIDLRISVIPADCGENVVIRLLDRNKMDFDIGMLGFSKENEQKFRQLISRPDGIMLLTGPTGSGKSTSLYAALSTLNNMERCIVTLEEPIEYRLPGLVQIPINTATGLNFPAALRSALRQDLDILLIGEIRDPETAEIAMAASNSGHMVFSTLHTTSAASSVIRLVKMGIEPFMVATTLTSVINQRLVRRICEHCKEEYYLDENSPFRKVLGQDNKKITLWRGKGCEDCRGTGFKGRLAVQEFLIVDDDIRETLYNEGNTMQIEQTAMKSGMKKIQQDGIDKVLAGLTTIDEVHRVVFFDDLQMQ